MVVDCPENGGPQRHPGRRRADGARHCAVAV